MSQTETYANLLSLIESYHGANLIDIEKTRVRHLVNARARSAYRESDIWDQFLVAGEDRVVNDVDSARMYVPFVGYTSEHASPDNAKAGDIDTVLRVHKNSPYALNSVREYETFMGRDGAELVGYKVIYGQETAATLWQGSNPNWTIRVATSMDGISGGTIELAGIVTNSTTIDAALNATHTITNVRYGTDGSTDFSFSESVAPSSVSIAAATIKLPTAYVTYKRRLTEVYGDQDGDTTSIPMEWRDYISLGVFADTLASDGFVEKSFALEARANKALQLELERLDRNRGNQFVNHRVRTHGSSQARQSSQL